MYRALLEQFQLSNGAVVLLYQPSKVNVVTACVLLKMPFIIKLSAGKHQDMLMWMKQVLLFNCSTETLDNYLQIVSNKFGPARSEVQKVASTSKLS
jgi:hypothetical protein